MDEYIIGAAAIFLPDIEQPFFHMSGETILKYIEIFNSSSIEFFDKYFHMNFVKNIFYEPPMLRTFRTRLPHEIKPPGFVAAFIFCLNSVEKIEIFITRAIKFFNLKSIVIDESYPSPNVYIINLNEYEYQTRFNVENSRNQQLMKGILEPPEFVWEKLFTWVIRPTWHDSQRRSRRRYTIKSEYFMKTPGEVQN